MRIILFLIAALWMNYISAQDTTMQAKYAFVSIPHYDNGMVNWDIKNACKAYFSNGSIRDLGTTIGLSNKARDSKNDSIVAQYEFKLLDYFYSNGYELIGVVQQKYTINRQFYFRHK
jgi:hypothetical protein